MRVLDLSGHYQRRVQIDTCPHCCLVWFDDTESVRLAGPGIAEFVNEIHAAMQAGGTMSMQFRWRACNPARFAGRT